MNQIKKILQSKGLKQTWLAQKLNKSYNTVNAYLQNRQQPRLEVLFQIAEILEVDVKDLIDDSKEKKAINEITVIDLFAGCGGLSEGFLMSGKYLELAHVEWELPMVSTLRNRLSQNWGYSEYHSKKKVIHFDIQKIEELLHGNWSANTIMKYGSTNDPLIPEKGLKGLVNHSVDIIIGGPPCQAYSLAGRAQDPNSMRDDYRNYLFESFVEVVKEFRPKLFVFENVPGLLSARPGGILVTERIHNAFRKIGYWIPTPKEMKNVVFSSDDFGVPQKRKRIILVGVREDMEFTYKDIYASINKKKIKDDIKTVKDALYDLPPLYPVDEILQQNELKQSHKQSTDISISEHNARYHNKRDVKIFGEWIRNNMNHKSSHERLRFYNELFAKKSKHIKYRNLEWDKPSPTVVAHLEKDGLMFIHPDPDQSRTITIREAARLQSFPDNFEFLGNQGQKYRMIGNAVPPLMANAIATAIADVINNN